MNKFNDHICNICEYYSGGVFEPRSSPTVKDFKCTNCGRNFRRFGNITTFLKNLESWGENMMRPSDVQKLVDEIKSMHDSEAQHGLEDDLHQKVLLEIANDTCLLPKECARIALTTREIKFSRWYA